MNWDLTAFYKSFNDNLLEKDLVSFKESISKYNGFKEKFTDSEANLVEFLKFEIEFDKLISKLYGFANLTLATESTNNDALNLVNSLSKQLTKLTETSILADKWISSFDLKKINNKFLNEHEFYLKQIKIKNNHNLEPKVEAIISKINQNGVSAFERQHDLLTSTLDVPYLDGVKTLSEIRNLAYSANSEERKSAFEAEIAGYPAIEKSIALSLNSIKGYVNTVADLRGYDSPLDKALFDSRLDRKTLESMIESIKDALPTFRKYLKRKASLLGHTDGLPFYDLFAPIGEDSTVYTVEQAQKYIVSNFNSFSSDLGNLAKRAFNENWIDYFPKKGKSGGAFCSNIQFLNQSRILSNFTGSFSDVLTLAHELGHAYHGDKIFVESPLNTSYTMPVAETASIMAETIVMNKAIKEAGENSLTLIESSLQDATQVVVDIYSRFLFEESVFSLREDQVLDENILSELMEKAQIGSYGDGLDPKQLHKYMWIPKGHYYSKDLSFYNFPYAFGLLFAKGLYARYLKEGESFVPKFDELLRLTGQKTVEDAALSVGITLDKEFWDASLQVVKDDIEKFLKLT